MLILSMKQGHDGAVVAIEDGVLRFALEAEKDNYPRYDRLTGEVLVRAADLLDRPSDVVALGGWVKGFRSVEPQSRTGYFGVGEGSISDEAGRFFGKDVRVLRNASNTARTASATGQSVGRPSGPARAASWAASNARCSASIYHTS